VDLDSVADISPSFSIFKMEATCASETPEKLTTPTILRLHRRINIGNEQPKKLRNL
jgi:hypothetical protein